MSTLKYFIVVKYFSDYHYNKKDGKHVTAYITFLKSEKHELTTGENPLASTSLATPFPLVSFIISSLKSLFLELIQTSAPIFLARSSLASFTSAHIIFLAPNQTKNKLDQNCNVYLDNLAYVEKGILFMAINTFRSCHCNGK